MSDRAAARAAKDHLRADLSRLSGVNGLGIGRRQGQYVVTVTVTEQTVLEHVPGVYEGVVVEVRVVGQIRALGQDVVDEQDEDGDGKGGDLGQG